MLKPISKQKIKTIRAYVKQGLSANKIQKTLQKNHMGMQRKNLLAQIRKIKNQKPKVNRKKYVPKKYRKQVKKISNAPRARKPMFFGKHVAVYALAKTRRHPAPYSARFEFYGSRKDKFKAVRLAFSGIVPRYERPHVKCSARDFLTNPYVYGERGIWVGRPEVESQ